MSAVHEWNVESTHNVSECALCRVAVEQAIDLAKCTGSRQASNGSGTQHVAIVERVHA